MANVDGRDEGVDVVVGVVDTHGRRETEALVQGLEVISRRHIGYDGGSLEEMDLDAVLARRPKLVLVDELAVATDHLRTALLTSCRTTCARRSPRSWVPPAS